MFGEQGHLATIIMERRCPLTERIARSTAIDFHDDAGPTEALRQNFEGFGVADAERRHDSGICDERLPGFAVMLLELADILDDRPKLHAEPGHQTRRRLDRLHVAKHRKLIEHEQDRELWFLLDAFHDPDRQ